jgi:hypothetical protein
MEDLVFSSSELEELEEIDKQVAEQLNEEGNSENIEVENQEPNQPQDNQAEPDGTEDQQNQGDY